MSILASIFDTVQTLFWITISFISVAAMFISLISGSSTSNIIRIDDSRERRRRLNKAKQEAERAAEIYRNVAGSDEANPKYVEQQLRKGNQHINNGLEALQGIDSPEIEEVRRSLRSFKRKQHRLIRRVKQISAQSGGNYVKTNELDADTEGIDRLRK